MFVEEFKEEQILTNVPDHPYGVSKNFSKCFSRLED